MTYSDALNVIRQKESLGIQPGLTRIQALLEEMGNPQDALNIIHIAGTNGKGTVAATVAAALIANGYKVGLFTSPWVIDYREQLQINGEFISESTLATYVSRYADSDCTEFEFLTAIMYRWFADEQVDYAVVECGMGGKGDATNVERENISVITAISLDHTNYLGSTIREIAEEKSGILRQNSPCIMMPDKELEPIFAEKCSRLYTPDSADNLSLVNRVLEEIGVAPAKALAALPARQERIGNILLDGGHNVAAAKMLAPRLHDEIAVIGMMKDKDVAGYLAQIAPQCQMIVATQPANPRAIAAADLAEIARNYCDKVLIEENPAEAVRTPQLSLVCGSFYLAREVRNILFHL